MIILIVKLVPQTPAMMVLSSMLVVSIALRYRSDMRNRSPWWLTPTLLWMAWVGLVWEWRSIESTSRKLTLDPIRPIVCMGDSLTEGMLPDRGFPEQLKSMVTVPVINLGVSGISTSQGLDQMDEVLRHNPQVVVIELGGHDFLKWHRRGLVKTNLTKMINMSRAQGAEVLLMEIPRGFIFDPYASLERQIAYEVDVQLVADTWLRQIVILSPVAVPGKWFPAWQLSDDGIHSNPRGSLAIAKRVASSLHAMYGDEVLRPQLP